MKNIYSIFFLLILGGIELNAQNLHSQANAASILNEADATTGWTGNAAITSSSVTPFQGSFCLSAVATVANGAGREMSYTFTAVVGEIYNISIWARVGISNFEPSFDKWAGFTGFNKTPISGNNWTQYTWTLTAKSTNPIIKVFTSPNSHGQVGNQVFIDSVSIIAVSSNDNTPPSAPTNLAASNTTTNSTDLSWLASTDNVGVTNYEVFRNGTSIGLSDGATNFSVTGLSSQTTYAFTVFARDAAGNVSSSSNIENVTTLASSDTTPPSAPTNLTASNTTSSGTNLSWTASTDNVGVTNYEVFRNGTSIGLSGGATNFNVTGLSPQTTYTFTVFARDAAGNVSASSNTANVTTLASSDTTPPSAPTNLSASNTTSNSTNLIWTASTDNVGVTNYEVFRNGTSIGLSGGATNFSVTGLSPQTTYSFTVFARDAAGNISNSSNSINVTTLDSSINYTSLNANLPTIDWTGRDLFANRNVGIGTLNTQGYRLAVAGNIIAEQVKVSLQSDWPDFVFKDDFDLPTLDFVEAYIKENGHLQNMPSAKEVEQNGILLGEMDAKLLQKIEELTLYIIQLNKKIDQIEKEGNFFQVLTTKNE